MDGVAMVSSLGLTFANAFLSHCVIVDLMNALLNLNLLFTEVMLTTFLI